MNEKNEKNEQMYIVRCDRAGVFSVASRNDAARKRP